MKCNVYFLCRCYIRPRERNISQIVGYFWSRSPGGAESPPARDDDHIPFDRPLSPKDIINISLIAITAIRAHIKIIE